MMKFLWFNSHWNHQPVIRTKSHLFGEYIEDITLSKKQFVLITGAHHSGKSRILYKLHDMAEEVWFTQIKPYCPAGGRTLNHEKPMVKREELDNWEFPKPVFLAGMDPLSKWVAHEGVAEWYEQQTGEEWKKVPAWRKPEILPLYLEATRAVLFIDDAHKLSGRKLMVTKQCFLRAFRAVVAADDENRVPPSLRVPLLDTNPQIIRLTSETAYDATNTLMWLLVVIAFVMGAHELAWFLGGLQLLGGGRRAGKQD